MAMRIGRALASGLVFCAFTVAAFAARADPASAPAAAPARYTFSWPLGVDQPRPRGGVSRGAPVVLDPAPSPAWQALQATGIDAAERDRRAILAMAGTFRVSFDFIEVATFGEPNRLAPYQSWATEKVYVDRDEPGFISLVHILEMRLVGNDGTISEPHVTKHWRQDWRYEPDSIVEYQGLERWRRRALARDEQRGAWLQTVHQVDESPRYAALGRWQHSASFSTWLSGDTWRPLPRREWSVRSDYQALLGTNRHTVTATGWLQEENNLKAVLAAAGAFDVRRPYVGREYGVARYDRLQAGADFAAADRYYAKTRAFWNVVAGEWEDAFRRQGTITLRGPVDKLGLFRPLFERADRMAQASESSRVEASEIKTILETMQAPR